MLVFGSSSSELDDEVEEPTFIDFWTVASLAVLGEMFHLELTNGLM